MTIISLLSFSTILLLLNACIAFIIFIVAIIYPTVIAINSLYVTTIILAFWLPKTKHCLYFAIYCTILIIVQTIWLAHDLWSVEYILNPMIIIFTIWITTTLALPSKIRNNSFTRWLSDSDQHKQFEEKLIWLSNHDELTGIFNRRFFNEHISIEWSRLMRTKTPLALIMIDVDYFKNYNDTLGHPAGDLCLKMIAQAIHQVTKRAGDFVARYGGEEFVLLLPNTTEDGLKYIANNIQLALSTLKIAHPYPKAFGNMTVSMGLSTMIPTAACTYDVLLKQADHALYQAKHAGRNCYRFYTETL